MNRFLIFTIGLLLVIIGVQQAVIDGQLNANTYLWNSWCSDER